MNLEKLRLAGISDTFWYGTENFGETGPEMEIPGRDLAFGRGDVWEGVQIWDKNEMAFEIGGLRRPEGKSGSRIEILRK